MEWPSHGKLMAHETPDPLNQVWDIYRSIQPTTPVQESDLVGADDRLHALELQRHLRHLSGEATLPWVFWPLLVLGALRYRGLLVLLQLDGFEGPVR